MSTAPTRYPVSTVRPGARHRIARVGVVTVAVLAPLALWAVTEYGFDLDLRSPVFGDRASGDIGMAQVLLAALAGSLLGWASLAALECLTVHARGLWTAAATTALIASLGGPLAGEGITTANRIVLALMHLVVAGVLIAGLPRSAPPRQPASVGHDHGTAR